MARSGGPEEQLAWMFAAATSRAPEPDELAVLDLDHDASIARVRPFWRPVGLRRGGPLDGLIDVPGAGEAGDDRRSVAAKPSRGCVGSRMITLDQIALKTWSESDARVENPRGLRSAAPCSGSAPDR